MYRYGVVLTHKVLCIVVNIPTSMVSGLCNLLCWQPLTLTCMCEYGSDHVTAVRRGFMHCCCLDNTTVYHRPTARSAAQHHGRYVATAICRSLNHLSVLSIPRYMCLYIQANIFAYSLYIACDNQRAVSEW